jgi:NAD-dependent dihydropyrimidine dehydrogenase PreA subunit
MPEIIITAVLIAAAGYIFYKNFKKSASGECNCGSCSSSCPKYSMEKGKKQD